MEAISVFDMFKIGIGPSSSHTLGPWRAARDFVELLRREEALERVGRLEVHLYGSLALTGMGHGTDIAILLGLMDYDPETVPLAQVAEQPFRIRDSRQLHLAQAHLLPFDPAQEIVFHYTEVLPGHANGMIFATFTSAGEPLLSSTYYSIGGGFIVREDQALDSGRPEPPFAVTTAEEVRRHCTAENMSIWELALTNELSWRSAPEVHSGLLHIWEVMYLCLYRGCHTGGELPGGLRVNRRAAGIYRKLSGEAETILPADWLDFIRARNPRFADTLKWIGCFAMAVNEENASFGRVVTSPTNGSAGVIPAVIMYYLCFADEQPNADNIVKFLLTAGLIGSIFKRNATISAAMGGCQAEIGVSSAMAAAALTEAMGGTVGQALMAAEIAMEHHLGLTCDPVGGLVQVPCIERNSMGAIKAITATHIALESDPTKAKVSLDAVIKTMWETAQDMNHKYKETSQGGLAVQISVSEAAC